MPTSIEHDHPEMDVSACMVHLPMHAYVMHAGRYCKPFEQGARVKYVYAVFLYKSKHLDYLELQHLGLRSTDCQRKRCTGADYSVRNTDTVA